MFAASVALQRGRRAGLTVMCGLIAGCWTWVCLLAGGMAAFFGAHPDLMRAVGVFGVVYVLYLSVSALRAGWKSLKRSPDVPATVLAAAKMMEESGAADAPPHPNTQNPQEPPPPAPAHPVPRGSFSLFLRGLCMAMANPLTFFFFVSFLPGYVDGGSEIPPAVQTLVLGGVFCALVPLVYVPEILAAGWVRSRFAGGARGAAAVEIFSGAVLLAVAFLLAVKAG